MMNGIQFQSVQTPNALSSELRSVIRDNVLQFYVQGNGMDAQEEGITALYERLSQEDKLDGESNSIANQEVRELLGKPYREKVKGQVGFEEYSTHDDRTDMIFYYRLREDIISGWEIYLIRFKNNVVFETETGVEDW